ncbi:MAG: lanthionine synthetase LanC family protein [Phycisphaerae bacterium]
MARNVVAAVVVIAAFYPGPLPAQGADRRSLPVRMLATRPSSAAVEFCLPLAEGELADPTAVRVLAGDKEAPSQVSALSLWPKDKSARVLWVRALAAGEKAPLAVEYGKSVKPAAYKTPLAVEKTNDAVTVTTGPLRVRMSTKGLTAIEQAWLDINGDGKFADDEAVLAAGGVAPVLTTLDGKSYVPAGKVELVVEEQGPVRSVVRMSGQLAPADKKDAAADELFSVVYRVKLYAGSPAVYVQTILKRPGRPFAFPAPKKEDVDREWELLVPVDAYGITVHLRSESGLAYAAGGAGKVIDQAQLAKDGKKLILASGDYTKNSPNVRFEAEGKATPGALEWLDASAAKTGVAAAARDAPLLFPKAYELDGSGKVQIDLWKDDPPRAALEIGSGFYRAHDLVLLFHGGKPAQKSGEQAAALTRPVRAAVPAEQFRASGVFGPLPKSFDSLPPGFDELQKTLVALDGGSRSAFGEHVYGKTLAGSPMPSGRMSYAGGAYNVLSVRGALFALYGKSEYLDDVDRMGRWTRDWDMKHRSLVDGTPVALAAEPSNTLITHISSVAAKETFIGQNAVAQAVKDGKRRLGVIQPASWCRGGPCQRNRDVSLEGMLYHYYLTGDPASGEAAREAANMFRWLATCPEDFGNPNHQYLTAGAGHRFHVGGKIMLNLMAAYEGLGDAKYLDAAAQIWKYMLTNTKTHKIEWPKDDELYWSGTAIASWPYQATNFLRPAYVLYHYTNDEALKEHADKLAKAIISERWDSERRQFWKGVHSTDKGQDTIVPGRIYLDAHSLPTATALGYAYLITGRKEYLDVAKTAYEYSAGRFGEMKAAGKFNYDICAGSDLTSFQGLVGAWEKGKP